MAAEGRNRRLLVLFGSQTGCAEEVAHRIGREAAKRFFRPVVMGMDAYDVTELPSESLVVAVTSTTGQGDAPDTMRAFWAFLLRKSLPPDSLDSVSFSVFGLGDSSYAKYNTAAKRLARRLEGLGASCMLDIGLGDDQDRAGYDQALDPWLASLWPALLAKCPLPEGAAVDESASLPPARYAVGVLAGDAVGSNGRESTGPPAGGWSQRQPFLARMLRNQLLTSGVDREVRHLELDIAGSGFVYAPGDIVAVQPRNRREEVEVFARELGLDLSLQVSIAPADPTSDPPPPPPLCGWGPVSLSEVLTKHVDFMATPRRYFFEMLAFFCPDGDQQERLEEFASVAGRDDLYEYCIKQKRSCYEVLRDFPAARPPLAYLLDLIGPIRPRLFSISSGPSVAPDRLSITAAMVAYTSKTLLERRGVCTSFLASGGVPRPSGPEAGLSHPEVGLSHPEAGPSNPEAGPSSLASGPGGTVPVWLKKGTMALPVPKDSEDLGKGGAGLVGEEAVAWRALHLPLIMVGPGTGLAPLRAFTQERAAVRRRFAARGVPVPKSGDLLFFGCRKEGEDYLYREEMEGWVADGDLRHLGVAFSRDTPAKEYVQDKIREAGRLVWEAFEAGGVVLVSGASEKMPNDVRKALVSVVAAHAPADEEAAEAYMKRVEAQRRYLQDTWS